MWWGLPFSLMSFVGNLIFSPIIVAFLAISSLIFMTELTSIPNYYLIWSLEKVTTFMTTLLSLGSKHWLVAFPKPNSVFLIAIPLVTIALIRHRTIKTSSMRKMMAMSCILATIFVYGYGTRLFCSPHSTIVPYTKNKLTVNYQDDGTIVLHDEGAFNTKVNPENYVNFELKSYLAKTYGTVTISKLILDKMSMRSMRAAHAICSTLTVTSVTLKKGTRTITKPTWRLYYKLKDILGNKVLLIQ